MNSISSWVAAPILALMLCPAQAATLEGRVVGITDDDTIKVLDADNTKHKIRLAAIDAPELKQAFGSKSKQNLSDLIYNMPVKVEWEKRDRYKRIVGKVLVTSAECLAPACVDVTDAGREQIAAGMAWHFKQYAKEQSPDDREAYAAAEDAARAARRGLWADDSRAPPWEWRRVRR